jgi:hypothetical protein
MTLLVQVLEWVGSADPCEFPRSPVHNLKKVVEAKFLGLEVQMIELNYNLGSRGCSELLDKVQIIVVGRGIVGRGEPSASTRESFV